MLIVLFEALWEHVIDSFLSFVLLESGGEDQSQAQSLAQGRSRRAKPVKKGNKFAELKKARERGGDKVSVCV